MKQYKIFVFLFFLFCCLFSNCKKRSNSIDSFSNVFKPALSFSARNILELGPDEVLGADIPMYKFTNEDTVTIFTLDFDKENILEQKWHIKVDSISDNLFQEFLIENEMHFQSKDEDGYFTRLYSSKYNQDYRFRIDSLSKEFIVYYKFVMPNELYRK